MITLVFHNDNDVTLIGHYGSKDVTLPPGISIHEFTPVIDDEASFLYGATADLPYGASQPWRFEDGDSLQVIYARFLIPEEGGGIRQVEKYVRKTWV